MAKYNIVANTERRIPVNFYWANKAGVLYANSTILIQHAGHPSQKRTETRFFFTFLCSVKVNVKQF